MRISHSLWRKLVVTFVAASGFVLLYQATILDSRYAARQALLREDEGRPGPGVAPPVRGQRVLHGRGDRVRPAAADRHRGGRSRRPADRLGHPDLERRRALRRHLHDHGHRPRSIRGRLLDIYMWNCDEALEFGRRSVEVFVLRLGWNPRASGPSLLDTLLPWRDRPAPLRARRAAAAEAVDRAAAVPSADGSGSRLTAAASRASRAACRADGLPPEAARSL